MDESHLLSQLAKIVGSENILFEQHELLTYASYFSVMWTKDAPRPYFPNIVVKPRTTAHVVEVMKLANEQKASIIPWGGGTGNTGGTLALTGGILLDLRAMNKILELDKDGRWVRVQAGIIHESLEKELARQGLMLGHDPGSFFSATIGGTISTSGVGVTSAGYGAMKDTVLGLEVVLPTGEILRTKPVDKSATVIENLNHLFIGTEGTFGIITEATLRVHPLPETRSIHVIWFKDFKEAMKMSFHLTERGIKPTIQLAIDYNRAVWFIPMLQDLKQIVGVLIIGFDGPQEIVEANDTILHKIVEQFDGEDLGTEFSQNWWDNRHNYPVIGRYWLEKAEVSSFASPRTFLEMHDRFVNLTEKHGLEFFGACLYANPWCMSCLAGFNEADKSATERFKQWSNDMIEASLELGGTIEAIHGVGLRLAHFMEREIGSVGLDLLKSIKRLLDPNNILNSGKRALGE